MFRNSRKPLPDENPFALFIGVLLDQSVKHTTERGGPTANQRPGGPSPPPEHASRCRCNSSHSTATTGRSSTLATISRPGGQNRLRRNRFRTRSARLNQYCTLVPMCRAVFGFWRRWETCARHDVGLRIWMIHVEAPGDEQGHLWLTMAKKRADATVRGTTSMDNRAAPSPLSRRAARLPSGLPARHTCGTLMHLQDVPIAVISAWLGHASKAFTMATYVHSQPDALAKAAESFSRVVGRGQSD